MQEEQPEKDDYLKKTFKIMGLAIALPSSILGLFFIFKNLEEKQIIPEWSTLLAIVIYVIFLLFIMVKYGSQSKNKSK